MNATVQKFVRRLILVVLFVGAIGVTPRVALAGQAAPVRAEQATHEAGEANLVVPDLSTVTFRGWNGRTLLMAGLGVCALGLLFGLMTFTQLKNLPVPPSMPQSPRLTL